MTKLSLDAPQAEALVRSERVDAHIALVTLDRPQVCNTVNQEAARQLTRIVSQLERDDTIRAVVLTGAGNRAFCAGADLAEVAGAHSWNIADGFAGFVSAERSKPWIAAVRGHALGGGLELALACEMIVAGEGAQFGLPELRRCLIPGAGGVYRLPRIVPRAIATEMLLTGESIHAYRAYEIGLVNHVVADDQVLPRAFALASSIADNAAPMAVREAMRLLKLSDDHREDELARQTVRAIGRLMHSEDFAEGPRAFFERRTPRWRQG